MKAFLNNFFTSKSISHKACCRIFLGIALSAALFGAGCGSSNFAYTPPSSTSQSETNGTDNTVTGTPTPTGSTTATATPVPTATPLPTIIPTPTPVPTPTPKPTATPVPTATPAPTTMPTPTPAPIPPLACAAGSTSVPTPTQYYPTSCLTVPSFLTSTSVGLEISNGYQISSKIFTLKANDQTNGASTRNLYIELATYTEPDTMVITAYDKSGNATQLLDICNISTATYVDPTGGKYRPYSDSILQFGLSSYPIQLPAGTVKLVFDYTNSYSPEYIGIWNLQDFSTALNDPTINPFNKIGDIRYRPQTGPLNLYNDNSDPTTGANDSCPNI